MNFLYILTVILAYLIGSMSAAVLICKILHYPDPRNSGSKNPGATNTLRIAGRKIAISVLIIDVLKGAIPVWISDYLNVSTSCLNVVAISVCLGHIYPIFFKFSGGKGVATALGAIAIMKIDLTIIMISIWVVTVLFFKYSSLASIITAIIIPFYTWYFQPQYLLSIITISLLIIIRHANNIKRLWHRKEIRIWRR